MRPGEAVLGILSLFDAQTPALSANDMAVRIGLPVSSTYRHLQILKQAGFLTDAEPGIYRLGHKVLVLASALRAENDLLTAARPVLRDLACRLNDTIVLQVVVEDHAVCLDMFAPPNVLQLTVTRGMSFPLHAGAGSRVLLAYLPPSRRTALYAELGLERYTDRTITDETILEERLSTIRQQGFDVSTGEFQEGVWSCSAPVKGAEGNVIASISAIGIVAAGGEPVTDKAIEALLEGAAQITFCLGQ